MITIEEHYNKAGDAGDRFVCYGIMGSLANLIQEAAECVGDKTVIKMMGELHDHLDTTQGEVAQTVMDDYERKYCDVCKDDAGEPLEMEYQATRWGGVGHTTWICKECGEPDRGQIMINILELQEALEICTCGHHAREHIDGEECRGRNLNCMCDQYNRDPNPHTR